jgi:hypothetical protein
MDIVGDVQGEQAIPIVDLHFHQGSKSSSDDDDDDHHFDKDAFFFLWDNYTWNANEMRGDQEGYDIMEMASFGFGAVPNCAMDFVNIEESDVTWSTVQGLHRSHDPGTGGFTTVHSRKSAANQYIPLGHEIFVTYGSSWYVCMCVWYHVVGGVVVSVILLLSLSCDSTWNFFCTKHVSISKTMNCCFFLKPIFSFLSFVFGTGLPPVRSS